MGPTAASSPSPNGIPSINHAALPNPTPNLNPSISLNLNPNLNPRHSTAFVSFSSIRSSARRITNSLSPVKQTDPHVFQGGKESPPRFSTDRSSTSSRSSQQTSLRVRAASSSTASLPYFPDQKTTPQKSARHHPSISAPFPSHSPPRGLRRVDGILPSLSRAATASSILRSSSQSSAAMIVTPFTSNHRPENGKPQSTSQSNLGFGQGGSTAPLPGSGLSAGHASAPPGSLQNPNTVYQHIQDISAKRISTLDYLRKA